MSRVSVCQECDLIVDTRPLAASISRSDSAGHFINLAKFRVRGEPGDRVTLTLTAAEDVFSVLGLDQRLLVDIGGDRTEFTFQELAAGATVHVFREPGEVYIQYMLNRHVRARPEGAVQLTQSVAGAQVVEAATPWVLAEARRPVLLSSLATAASCPVPAPGIHCGVAVGINPFVTGGVFGGFQSAEGTGASSTIVVTFSPAVSSVTVTALDPDFGGNRMVARNASGVVLTSAGFAGDGTPGEPSTSTVTVSAPGIASVRLVPARDDYVAYDNLSFIAGTQEPPCPPSGDEVGAMDSQEVIDDLLDALAESNPDGPPGTRQEQAGIIWQRPNGSLFAAPVPTISATECTIEVDFAAGADQPPEPGAVGVAKYHTHPHSKREEVFGCRDEKGTRFAQFPGDRGIVPRAADPDDKGGGSVVDWTSGTSDGSPMYVVYKDRRIYRLDPDTPRSARKNNPNKWDLNDPAAPGCATRKLS